MLTVAEAARRVGRNPETVRRWIRSGRLRSRRIGLQHLVDEDDLDQLAGSSRSLPLPEDLQVTSTGAAQPDWTEILRRSRRGR